MRVGLEKEALRLRDISMAQSGHRSGEPNASWMYVLSNTVYRLYGDTRGQYRTYTGVCRIEQDDRKKSMCLDILRDMKESLVELVFNWGAERRACQSSRRVVLFAANPN